MNPLTSEMQEGYGDSNSLFLIVGWFIYLMGAYGIAHALHLSHKNSLRLWAACNIAPIVFLVFVGHFSFLLVLGLSVMAWSSYAMGRAVFDNREKERVLQQRILEEMNEEEKRSAL